jgi:type I protein arginine methyltransferase
MAEFTAPSITSQDNPFTHYYAQLLHQGNMLADHVRTSTYQKAMLDNAADFKDAVVLDVGTGTGILSFFACQAGAKKVYAVEASDSAEIAKKLAAANGYSDRVEVIKGRLEEIELPEKVDIIISEPIGFLLVHERMLESYAFARKAFLKPGGLMFPSTGSIVLAPITDQVLFDEQTAKIEFWKNTNFYGIDLSAAVPLAQEEYYTQPIVGYFPDLSIISPNRTVHTIDFNTILPEEFHEFTIEYVFRIDTTSIMHGLGGWFDIDFQGRTSTIVLSTAPDQPGTHWYQCRLLFHEPVAVNKGQYVSGELHFRVNDKHSYNITMTAKIDGTHVETSSKINLHDQQYNYLYNAEAATSV